MEINRNQYFAIGVVVLFLGIQFRYFESFTLNAEATTWVREAFSKKNRPSLITTESSYNEYDNDYNSNYNSYNSGSNDFWGAAEPVVAKTLTVKPPKWIGWALLSAGGVLVLHSLAMQKPG